MSKDEQLVKQLAKDEDARLAEVGTLRRRYRQALAVRKEMEGEYRKAGMARAESQKIMDRIQSEVEPVEKVIVDAYKALCVLGEAPGRTQSTIPEEKPSG